MQLGKEALVVHRKEIALELGDTIAAVGMH